MKKGIVVALVVFGLILMPTIISAQTWGFNVGINSATFGGDDAENYESKTGFMFGALSLYPLAANGLCLHVEANYTLKGSTMEGRVLVDYDGDGYGDAYIDAKQTIKLTYVEIPILLQYNVKTKGSVQPIFYAGPAVALKMSSKYKLSYSNTSDTETMKNVKSIDFGLVIGGGIAINKKYYVSARYTMGLASFSDVVGVDLKNNVISGIFSMTI